MGKIFQKPYFVTYYDSDVFEKMRLSHLTNICMFYSGIQSKSLGRGDDYINNLGLTWVVTNYEMKINRLPHIYEEIEIFTEAKSYNNFFCYREFWVEDTQGNELVRILATFVLMNMETRKMERVNDEILVPYGSEKINHIFRPSPIAHPENAQTEAFRVRFSEIDVNQHVNNTKYIEWILDVLDFDFRKTHQMKQMNVRYVKEIEMDAQIESHFEIIEQEQTKTLHIITVEGNIHFEAEVIWEKTDEV